ncbi:MAG: EamA family transporter RarD [Rhizobiales bacterium]|nr:EamA family transporter RarD [Hyphomicrobiales bacterium]
MDTSASATTVDGDTPRGFAFAVACYTLWGLLPFYMKAVEHMPAAEVVAHRIIWSLPIAGVTLYALGRTADVRRALRSPRTLAMAALTASIITINWGTYVWAIAAGRTIETALGYYINPLVSIVMGAVLLGEKLSRIQMVAVALATLAVVILAVDAGGVPWVSLVLAFSFAIYGFLRKTLPIGPSQGFFLEVLILMLPAIGYVLWLQSRGESHFLVSEPGNVALLLGCGPVTAVPLILYAFGTKLLRYSTICILQYIGPTMIFAIAVFIFHEPFGMTDAIAFGLIWLALVIYSWSMVRGRRALRPA